MNTLEESNQIQKCHMSSDKLQGIVNRLVREVFQRLYEIHRPNCIGRCSLGSDAFAEAYGNFDIAFDAIKGAQAAALEELTKPEGTKKPLLMLRTERCLRL